MTLSLMAYGVVLGAWLSGSAFFLDRGLRALGRPTRWIWTVGLAGAAGIPLLAGLAGRAPVSVAGGNRIPVGLFYEMLAREGVATPGTSTTSGALDPIVLFLWILGSSLILLSVLWTYLRLRRIAGRWQRRMLGGEEILVSDGLGPAVLGLMRPTIVLPPWALAVGEEKLEMILLHEREHRTARDPTLLTLALLALAVSPWNPALWWMVRRLRLAVEGDCDRRVLARGIPVKAYGDLLLEVASGARGVPSLAPALAEGGHTFLERRLLMIRSTVRKHRFGVAALAGPAGSALLALACETPTPPVQMEEEAGLEASSTVATLTEADEGYFLLRKTGDQVENLGAVPPEKLKLIREEAGDLPFGVMLKKAAPQGEGEAPEGVAVRVKEAFGSGDAATLKPLVIVDGVIMSDPDFLDSLGPESIESIEVVRGGAAEALYGERAAGGVIQIRTKH